MFSGLPPAVRQRVVRPSVNIYSTYSSLLEEKLGTSNHHISGHCPKFKQQSALTSKRYEIGCELLLITNMKSHTVFRLVPTSVTCNELERRNSPYFALFHRIR